MKTSYLDLEEILRLHFQVIEDFGGIHGVRDEARLMSIVQAPRQVVFGQEQYSTFYDKAAVYFKNIIGDHPFIDGNNRTAITVCGIFLVRNGIDLNAKPEDLENFTIQVIIEHLNINDIAVWLKAHTNDIK